MKEIISTIEVVLDAQTPNITHKVLFKGMISNYDSESQSETFMINSYKVIDDATQDYEFLKKHVKTLDKATLDAMRAAMTITSTDYTDVRNEELVKGTAMLIDSDGIFGLAAADLTLR